MLVVTHINMILKGQTTVESVQIVNMKERENRRLAKGFECWEIRSVKLFVLFLFLG
jgi:palmitoyltransferase